MIVMRLTLFIPMVLSIKLHTVKSGLSIKYIEGSQIKVLLQNIVVISLKIDFVSASMTHRIMLKT